MPHWASIEKKARNYPLKRFRPTLFGQKRDLFTDFLTSNHEPPCSQTRMYTSATLLSRMCDSHVTSPFRCGSKILQIWD